MQRGLFEADWTIPYRENLLSVSEEKYYVRHFQDLKFEPFNFHGYLGNRRTVSYGWHYDFAASKLQASNKIPEFLTPLKDIAETFTNIPASEFEHLLVTEYAPGAGIGWHSDKPTFDKVVAFSFCAPCVLRFRRKLGSGWERRKLSVMPRSAYLLEGEMREDWQHSISPGDKLRYSVTLRTLRKQVS